MDERFQEAQTLLICLICRQAEAMDGVTSVHFERGEMRLVMNNVPARICPRCEEAYVEEQVAMWLLRKADEIFVSGELNGAVEYDYPAKFLDFHNPQ